MSILKVLKNNVKIAIFTRNHEYHLLEALNVSTNEPEKLIAFRAITRWVSARTALQNKEHIPIYFAVVDKGSLVSYVAQLDKVIVNPQKGQKETDDLLNQSTRTTEEEGLWENKSKPVGTLYGISHLIKLEKPFDMTYLKKIDDTPISPNYNYAYSIVYAYPDIATKIQD